MSNVMLRMSVRPAMSTVVLALAPLKVAVSAPDGKGDALQLAVLVQKH